MKRLLSVMLILTMLIGGASVSAFAAGKTKAPNRVYWIKAYSSYKGVTLEWSPTNASSYDVYRDGKYYKNVKSTHYTKRNGKKLIWFYDRTGQVGGKGHSYYVVASKNNVKSAKSDTVRKKSAYPMYITATFRTGRTLTSHDSGSVTRHFSPGQQIKAYSFRFGKYIFEYKGSTYYCNYNSLKNFSANTTNSFNYSGVEAEYFVNSTGIESDTNYLIWANLYTQRLFVFKRSGGKWVLYKNLNYNGVNAYTWKISSGKATSPTPAGLGLNIYKKQRRKNNVNYWNYFHSQTSLHGKVGNQPFDRPRSEGCIRNPDKYAMLIYNKIPVNTRVIVY